MTNRQEELQAITKEINQLQQTIRLHGSTANSATHKMWGDQMVELVIKFRKLNASPIKKSVVN